MENESRNMMWRGWWWWSRWVHKITIRFINIPPKPKTSRTAKSYAYAIKWQGHFGRSWCESTTTVSNMSNEIFVFIRSVFEKILVRPHTCATDDEYATTLNSNQTNRRRNKIDSIHCCDGTFHATAILNASLIFLFDILIFTFFFFFFTFSHIFSVAVVFCQWKLTRYLDIFTAPNHIAANPTQSAGGMTTVSLTELARSASTSTHSYRRLHKFRSCLFFPSHFWPTLTSHSIRQWPRFGHTSESATLQCCRTGIATGC